MIFKLLAEKRKVSYFLVQMPRDIEPRITIVRDCMIDHKGMSLNDFIEHIKDWRDHKKIMQKINEAGIEKLSYNPNIYI